MPAVWVLSPLVDDNGIMRPKVATLIDPGVPTEEIVVEDLDENDEIIYILRTITYRYLHASITDGTEALSMVWGVDMSPIIADRACTIILDGIVDDPPQGNSPLDNELGRIARYSHSGTQAERDEIDTVLLRRTGEVAIQDTSLGERLDQIGVSVSGDFSKETTVVRPSRSRLEKAGQL